ncbi:hypothetical protein MG293_008886 [Ovis ammon polii]|uniref:Uncharacterized protein n=1 Tax=Ovis ammon polii TaxID=230172 RepID=A0AAD4UCK2_OVIAM|nr:hypothetical protein MG293_008886 [Ovis ammon polii]
MGGAWDGVGEPSCLLQAPYSNFCTWGLPPHHPPSPNSRLGCVPSSQLRMSRQAVGWLAGPSVKKGSQMCPCLADPRPLLVQAWWGPGWPASSQQPVTQEEAALGPPDR